MGGEVRGGGRGHGGGRLQGSGQGVRRRRRDGSGRGAAPGRGSGAGLARGVLTPATVPALAADVTANVAAIVPRTRTVAIVAHADLCTLCEACLDACPRGAITLRETAEVDAALCTGCRACEDVCPNSVFELSEV